jgi:hypothetical protein
MLRWRRDKKAEEADSLDNVRRLLDKEERKKGKDERKKGRQRLS